MVDPASVEQQLADLADLKAAKVRRQLLPRGTAAWAAALSAEDDIIRRIRRWSHPTPGDRP
jgi:hypothetical protein